MSEFLLQEDGSALLSEDGGKFNIDYGENLFAEVIGGIVQRVIVATQAFIDSGKVGDPANWIETRVTGSIRGKYAGPGDSYDSGTDIFTSN